MEKENDTKTEEVKEKVVETEEVKTSPDKQKRGTVVKFVSIIMSIIFSGILIVTITKQNDTPTTYQLQEKAKQTAPSKDIAAKDIAVKILRNDPLAPKDYDYYMANKATVDELVEKYRKAQKDINTLKDKQYILPAVP